MPNPVLVTNPARPRDHGSGFVIRRLDGGGVQVVTCSHVVRALGATGLQVAGQPASVVIDLVDQGVDLAVLAVPGLTEPGPLDLAAGRVDDAVEVVGFEPGGGGPLAVPHRARLVAASLTAIGGHNRPAWQLELTDGDIEGGHSGGPVIAVATGKVVGVISMGPEQQGGRDGVAVAIENLRLWPDAPVIAGRALTPLPDDSSSSSRLPAIVRPVRRSIHHVRRWWWVIALSGATAIGGASLTLRAWSSTSPTAGCAIPDLRESYDQAPLATWCPDTVDGATPCVQRFDDGGVITGHCQGTDVAGDWAARDATGVERWHARFAAPGQHPTAVLVLNTRSSVPRVTIQETLTRGVLTDGGKVIDASHVELQCQPRSGGAAMVSRDVPDVAEGDSEVRLTLPTGVMRCSIHDDVATSCRIGDQQVIGPMAAAAYQRLVDAEDQIRGCNVPKLPALPECGDGFKSGTEACDNRGPVESATCDVDCTRPVCGDGLINHAAGEVCDDHGESPRCDKDCTLPRCGDGVINHAFGERCETTAAGGTATCDNDCTLPMCGDGVVNAAAHEQCDPGAARETAECTATCTRQRHPAVPVRVPGSP